MAAEGPAKWTGLPNRMPSASFIFWIQRFSSSPWSTHFSSRLRAHMLHPMHPRTGAPPMWMISTSMPSFSSSSATMRRAW